MTLNNLTRVYILNYGKLINKGRFINLSQSIRARGFKSNRVQSESINSVEKTVGLDLTSKLSQLSLYSKSIYSKYREAFKLFLIVPAAASLLTIYSLIDFNPYTRRIRFLSEHHIESDIEDYYIEKDNLNLITSIDPKLKARIDQIFKNLVKASGEDRLKNMNEGIKWHLIDSKDPDAYVIANGTIYITLGLIEKLKDFDQLAFILAHELSHYLSEHTNEKKTINNLSLWAGMAGAVSIGFIKNIRFSQIILAQAAIQLALRSIANWNSRLLETEADSMGVHLGIRAGYNPDKFSLYYKKSDESDNNIKSIGTSSWQDKEAHLYDSDSKQLKSYKIDINIDKIPIISNIDYYLNSTHPSTHSRQVIINEEVKSNKDFIQFAKLNPNFDWRPLYECDFWKIYNKS